MAFRNFKVETDADGIALVTWDIPGRSMNVLDETTIAELEESRLPLTPRSRVWSSHRARKHFRRAPIFRCWKA
jgi:hypothetical protein